MLFAEELMRDIKPGDYYRLTEIVEGKEVSSGEYLLVLIEERKINGRATYFPALGFSKTKITGQEAKIYLVEAHTQFGDPTWRHAFKCGNDWKIYSPAGASSWNRSYVKVEKI